MSDLPSRPRMFVPNEIMFLLDSPKSLESFDNDTIANFLRRSLEDKVAQKSQDGNLLSSVEDVRRLMNFRLTQPLGFKPTAIKGEATDRHSILVHASLPEMQEDELLRGVYAIFQRRDDKGVLSTHETGLRWVGVTPNWLMAGSPNEPPAPPDSGASGGGTANKPVPPQGPLPTFQNPWDIGAPCNFRLSPPNPQNFQSPAVESNVLQKIADAFGIPISTPPTAEDMETISNMSYDMLDHILRTRTAQRTAEKTVKVVILDTAPPVETPTHPPIPGHPIPLGLVEAYQQWGANSANPLLRSLLYSQTGTLVDKKNDGSKGLKSDVLTITYNKDFDDDGIVYQGNGWNLCRACQIEPNKRYWAMDHGLFIAGIIHTLAPQVKIHLIETLNAYGAGTLSSYVWGLNLALDPTQFDPETEILVVNMSFTFPIALDPNHPSDWMRDFDAGLFDKDSKEWGDHLKEFLTFLTLPMQLVLQSIASVGGLASSSSLTQAYDLYQRSGEVNHHGGVVVAAAGNNGTASGPRPAACAPAAFSTVLGVAALKSDSQDLTDYSNEADIPTYQGLAVIGGEGQSGTDLSDPNKGLLGLYIGDYPAPITDSNTTGWARWTGTSFAAPIVSGLLAELMRQGWTIEESLAMVRFSFGETNGIPDRLRLQQGM